MNVMAQKISGEVNDKTNIVLNVLRRKGGIPLKGYPNTGIISHKPAGQVHYKKITL